MGPGFGRAIAESMVTGIVLLVIATFLLGYGCNSGCAYVRNHYSVEVKAK